MNLSIILLGMAIFAGLHSLMASQSFKSHIRIRVGDRKYYGFYRLFYNVIATISLAPITLAFWLTGDIIWQLPDNADGVRAMLLVIQMLGALGVAISLLQIDLGRFVGVTQAWAYVSGKELPLPPEKLQRGGLYRLVRHPLYLFGLMSMWSVTTITDSLLIFNLAATIYFIVGSRWEEQRMVKAFGQDYIAYQQQVPWLIPFVNFR